MNMLDKPTQGWTVGQSIMMELSFSMEHFCLFTDESKPNDSLQYWEKRWRDFWGDTWNPGAVFAHLGILADVIDASDYTFATLATRKLTLQTAMRQAEILANKVAVSLTEDAPLAEKFVELSVRTRIAAHQLAGFSWNPEIDFPKVTRQQYEYVVRILRDGDLHDQFWQLVDQFYYEFFKSWRQTKLEEMKKIEEYVISHLGSAANNHDTPPLDWLKPQNPLRYSPDLTEQINSRQTHVFFWIDPYALDSAMSIRAGMTIVNCHYADIHPQEYRKEVTKLAQRLKALSDPTRLIILRLIHDLELDNTQMANFLEIARPTVSVHTKILREAGLIESHQEGRSTKHYLLSQNLYQLASDITTTILGDHVNQKKPDERNYHEKQPPF